ncbi:hypothetical protein ABPG75_008244, partial [Micractinium tetrahymenae]
MQAPQAAPAAVVESLGQAGFKVVYRCEGRRCEVHPLQSAEVANLICDMLASKHPFTEAFEEGGVLGTLCTLCLLRSACPLAHMAAVLPSLCLRSFLGDASELGSTSLGRLASQLGTCSTLARHWEGQGVPAPLSLLCAAAAQGRACILQLGLLLLERSALDSTDDAGDGCTLLHAAATGSSTAAVQSVLNLVPGAVFARDGVGQTALHRAAALGHAPVVELLLAAEDSAGCLEEGSIAGWPDEAGLLPLHAAAEAGCPVT